MHNWQSKYCLHWWLLLLVSIGINIVDGLALRNSGKVVDLDERGEKSAIKSTWSAYISNQNLFGLITLSLIFFCMILGFFFKGFNSLRKYRVEIARVQFDKDQSSTMEDESSSSSLPLTLVMKLNTENPVHYIIPVGPNQAPKGCMFTIDPGMISSKLSFSIILREGNIPIHFESVPVTKFIVNKESSLIYTLSNFSEPKLNKTKIIIHYSILR